jgi:predicted AlkP superfamily phosphohydrolase/phosphomutase
MGTGQVYLNLQGREGQGIVSRADAPALAREIADRLMKVADGRTPVMSNVYLGAEIYKGAMADVRGPDLQLAFKDGWQTSRKTSLGGIPEGLFEDNEKKWSGDHSSSDAADTQGFVVTNAGAPPKDAHIADLAPTALALLGVPVPATYEGKAWSLAP